MPLLLPTRERSHDAAAGDIQRPRNDTEENMGRQEKEVSQVAKTRWSVVACKPCATQGEFRHRAAASTPENTWPTQPTRAADRRAVANKAGGGRPAARLAQPRTSPCRVEF